MMARRLWLSRVLFTTAVLLVLMGDFSAAADRGSDDGFRHLQLGYIALDQGDYVAAMGHYSRARELASSDEQRFNALLGLGSAALELDRLVDAREALDAAHALRPGEAGATYLLGATCRRQGEMEIAVKYLAEAAARDPDLTQALVELAIAYAALERHADAERLCREVVEREPDNVEAHLGLAVALFHQDKNKDAVEVFRRVLELDPSNTRAHYGLGLALVYSGDRKAAIDELRYLDQHAPELADELYGWIYPNS